MLPWYMLVMGLSNVWPNVIRFGILCTGISVSNIQEIILTGMPGMPCGQ